MSIIFLEKADGSSLADGVLGVPLSSCSSPLLTARLHRQPRLHLPRDGQMEAQRGAATPFEADTPISDDQQRFEGAWLRKERVSATCMARIQIPNQGSCSSETTIADVKG